MAFSVHWRLMFRFGSRDAFQKCLDRSLALLGPDSVPGEGQPYCKIPDLWECRVSAPAPAGTVADQGLGTLLAANRLDTGWRLNGSLSPVSVTGFSGVLAVGKSGGSAHIAGLEWASFDLAVDAEPGDSTDGGVG
jgi:hypothetical protein